METKKGFSNLSVAEIRERGSRVTAKQKEETETKIKSILDELKKSARIPRTSFDDVIQEERARFWFRHVPYK